MGRLLGEKVGIIEAVDVDERKLAWGEFLRVQVKLLVSKTLLRGSEFSIEMVNQCGSISHMREYLIFTTGVVGWDIMIGSVKVFIILLSLLIKQSFRMCMASCWWLW